jgi:exosortase
LTSSPDATLDYTALPISDAKEPVYWGLPASAWLKILVVTGLLVALFRFNIARLWDKANPLWGTNWQHTFFIPVIGLYYLYLNSDRLLAARVKPILFERFTRTRLIVSGIAILGGLLAYFAGGKLLAAVLGPSDTIGAIGEILGLGALVWGGMMLVLGWGLGNLIFGLLVFTFGIYPGQNDWLKDYGMVHTIFGTVLTLCGWEVMKIAWFPIAFLICGIPWPGLVYTWLSNPLQHLAAVVAVKTLNLTGIDSGRIGTKMFVTGSSGVPRMLNVEEACSGLKSLMTFVSVAAAVGFLSTRALWQKLLITASAVPIAIFCNVLRVTGQAYIDRLAGPQWSENFAHQFVGLVMFIPAFVMILGFAWVLDHLFVEEVDDKARLKAAMAAKRGSDKVIVAAPKPQAAVPKTQAVPAAAPAKAAPAAAPVAAAAKTAVAAVAPVKTAPKPAAPAPVPSAAPAPARPAAPAPARPAAPAPPPPARMPPRQNLTGKPARPAPPPTTPPGKKEGA